MIPEENKKKAKDFITKEFFILFIPFLAVYLWTIFYEVGYASYFGVPYDLIDLNWIEVLAKANRLTFLVAIIAFLCVSLYYNLIPRFTSTVFKGLVIIILALSISLGYHIGKRTAGTQIDYLITNFNKKEFAVLQIDEKNIILIPFDRQTKQAQKSFSFLELNQDPNLNFTWEPVGPLQIQ